jgi:hypothetical protein
MALTAAVTNKAISTDNIKRLVVAGDGMILGILLWFSLSLGVQGYSEQIVDDVYWHPPIFAEVEMHAEGELLDIYAIYLNEMEPINLASYRPINDYFTVGAKLKIPGGMSLNYEHMCQHPVSTFNNPLKGEYGGYNKI